MVVCYRALLNVYGTPAVSGGYTFMPADVVLEGSSFSLGHPLSEHLTGGCPPVLLDAVKQAIDVCWVRGRLPCVFGFTPDPAEAEKALLGAGFAAVAADRTTCYPFVCTDHYGRTALMFSDHGPEDAIKASIAAAFWEALLQDPDDLADFETRVYHPGASVWLTYGCEAGWVYCDESDE